MRRDKDMFVRDYILINFVSIIKYRSHGINLKFDKDNLVIFRNAPR